MKPPRILIVVAGILLSLVLVQGVQAAETYGYVTQWGSFGTADGQFKSPSGVAVNSTGYIYVSDYAVDLNRIQIFNSTGGFKGKWGSTGMLNGEFDGPDGITVNSSGYVYVVDHNNDRVQVFTPVGTFIQQWGGFSNPNGIAVNSSGYVYVSDANINRIKIYSPVGTYLGYWGSTGSEDGNFTLPYGIAIDTSDNVYVTDYSLNRTQKFTEDGTFITKWGSTGSGSGEFNNPRHIDLDTAGNVYVVDSGNNRIQKFDSSGGFLTQWGTAGSGDGQFNGPGGIAVDSGGSVYVSDIGNDRIQKFISLDVTSCRAIDNPGNYVLKNNILNSTANICINISSSDVTFNGNDFTIDGTDTGSSFGIYAHHTSKTLQNVNIRNVKLTDWNYGLEFYNVNSSSIENTTSNYQTQGFYLIGHYLNLAKNNASFNTVGCSLIGNYNNLNHNTFVGNENYGIQTSDSHNIITVNTISNTSYQGILLANGARNNTISNNSIMNSGWGGIYLFNTGTENNTIVNNSIFNCQYPFYIDRASNNTIFNNYFNNTFDGVYFYSPIYSNIWNTTKTAGTNIIGGSNFGGNYWGNTSGTGFSQTCTDVNSDGICDSAYNIATGNIDYLPLTNKLSVPAPIAAFHGTPPLSGLAPLTVAFTDASSGSPDGWAWFFGDENYSQAWTEQTASAGWSARYRHSSVVMPDGSIVLMGGNNAGVLGNDVWRSTDNGETWTQQTEHAGWSARQWHSSVAMPDGSIVLTGGWDTGGSKNDVWRSTDSGTTWTQQTANAGWTVRSQHSSVALPDGSIVLTGGNGIGPIYKNDVWRSTDNGETWTQINASPGWTGRYQHSSVVMGDGTIVLTGGNSLSAINNDVWRSTDKGASWTQMNPDAGWPARRSHSSVAMPDGSILLMGGEDGGLFNCYNDVWRSTDNGTSWTEVNAGADWVARYAHSSAVLPDGSILLLGGIDSAGTNNYYNDVWRLDTTGSSLQNPSHTYTVPGNYSVALQVYNAGGYNSTRKAGYISVTGSPTTVINGTIINQSATVFIGEGGLDITPALAQANEQTGTTGLTTIGWWASPDNRMETLPSQTYNFGPSGASNFTVGDTFVGYTGNWYLVKADGTGGAPVFNIQDPALSLNIWDFHMDADVTGYAVTYGQKLGFRVNTNMYPSVNMTQRSPLDPATDGYIDIKVKDPNGAEYTTLLNDSVGTPAAGPNSLLANFVDAPAWYWGGFDSYGWQTAALDSGGSLYYPSGTYSVYAESTLHGMKDNYKNGGADYITKTVSPTVTFELVNHTVKIESDKDTIVRGEPFSVTVTGRGRTIYHVWVTNTSDLAGGPDGQPPMVNSSQAGVQYVPVLGSADAQRADAVATELSALGYAYQNAGADRIVFDDVAHSADTGYGTRTGFNIVTSVPGNRTVEFVTTNWTKAQRYTIHVEQNFGSESSPSFKIDEVDVNVEAGTAPVANFTANATYGAAPLTVQFMDTSYGFPTAWNWSFGDGTFSASQNPIHTYSTAGIYTVSLNASNAGGYNIMQKTGYISVTGSPEPGFITLSVTPMIGPVGTVFHFSGANTYGDSPDYYTNIFVVNNTIVTPGGSLPVNGVRPDDFSIETISGDNSTIYRAPVVGGGWSYYWDTSGIAGGSLLPGSLYTFYVVNETRNVSTLSYGSYTKAQVAIEGPVEADYIVNTSYGTNPLTVEFTDISMGIPTTVNLSFGDGTWTNSTGSWVHTYTNEGTFFPVIYASNSISSDSGTNATISVNVTSGLEKSLAEAYNVVLADETILDGTSEGTAVSAIPEKFDAGIKSVDVWGGKPALDLPQEPGWLIFIDDYPGANWEHPCRYVFVDDDGKTTVIEAMSPPLNIDTDQIAGETSDPWGDTNSVNSASPNPGGGLGTLPLVPECSNPDCSHNYALLISGGFNASQNHIRYWNDISFMYQTLNQTYGYPADHITVLMSDGTSTAADRHNATVNGVIKTDNSPVNLDNKITTTEVIRDATRTTLESTLTSLRTGGSKALVSTDSLFIFTTSHGGIDTVPGVNNSILYLWNKEYINDTEFVSKLPTQCKNITLVMEQCYSGGFVDNFIDRYTGTSQGRIIATAASSTEPSWGNGFSNAWTSGVARIDDRLNPNDAADTNSDNHISMAEAFNYAVKADPSASSSLANHEHPQYKAKNPVTAGTARFLNSCPVPVAKSIRVTRPNTAESWKQQSTYYITWTESGLSTVNISLWKAGAFNRYIAQVPASPSGYLWTVPTLTIASDYYINISSVGTSPIIFDRSNTNFAIAASGAPGYLWVNTSPVTGATIYIDRVVNGATNKKLTLNNGDHNVTVTRSGYYSMQSTATVKSSQTAVANFILTEIQTNDPEDTSPFGSITIDSNVPGAEVFIDGKDTGLTTPAAITEIWAGEHDVYVTSYGYEIPQAQTVYVPRHTSVNAYIELTLGTSNVPPLVNAGDDATIDKGSAFVSSGYFTDPGPGTDTWTATVDYGDGTGIQQLALNADYTFELSHPFADIGVYTVLVNVTDDKGGVGTDTVMVTVTATTVNIAPVVNTGPDVAITKGSTFFQIGSFTDPGPGADTWTATVDYGDGVVDPVLSLNPDNTFGLSHVYAATGLYTVTVTVRDDKGGTGSDSATIMVNDFAISGDYSADEGTPYTLSLISNGPGAATITGWNITWGDGPVQEVTGNPGSVIHTYADGPNTYGISATVTDGIGTYQTQGTVAVTVNNVAPTVDSGQDKTISEDSSFTQSGSFIDPGADTWTATVDYGDGSGIQPLALNADKSYNLNHYYSGSGDFTVNVTVTDKDGGAGSDTVIVRVSSAALIVDAGADAVIDEGGSFTQSGSFTDAGTGPWTATVDYGDGSGIQPLVFTAEKTFVLSHTFSDNREYTVIVTISDIGRTGSDTATVIVNNVAPTVDAGQDKTINEGSSFTQSGSFTDPGADTWTATVDYGDGSGIQLLTIGTDRTFSLSHSYSITGIFTVSVTVTDKDGGAGSDTVAVKVNGANANSAPVVNAGPDAAITRGSTFSQSGSFIDPDAGDTWTATVNYGDGSGTRLLSLNAGKTFSLSHVYTRNGVFTVSVAVTDKAGTKGSDAVIVTVTTATNVAPVVNAGPDAAITRGNTFSQSGSFIDPDAGDTWTATVNYGDGSGTRLLSLNADKTFSLSHVYTRNGVFTVSVAVTDKAGTKGSDAVIVTVTTATNVAPVVNAGPDAAITRGSTFSQSGSFIDPDAADTWTATVNYGDGSGTRLLSLNADKTFSLSHVYTRNGVFTVSIAVTDKAGTKGSDAVIVTVTTATNVAPVVNAGPDAAITRGSTFSQSGSFIDPDAADTWTATVNYGDGSGTRLLSLNADKTFSLSHVYTRNGVFTVSVAVTDKAGTKGSDAITVTVTTATNVAPVVNAGPDAAITKGNTFSQGGSFTDPDTADTWIANVSYGDGSGIQSLAFNADKIFTLSHLYADVGVYTVAVNVTDNKGGGGTDTVIVTVTETTIAAQVQIVPQPLNIGRTGYFIAFVRLPAGYRAADVDAGSVFCENKQALKLIRVKLFPQMFAAIFSRQDLAVSTGNIKMTVRGSIEKNGAVVPFSGVTNVYVINKKVTTKEDTDSVMSMTDTQIFTKFNK